MVPWEIPPDSTSASLEIAPYAAQSKPTILHNVATTIILALQQSPVPLQRRIREIVAWAAEALISG
jgi:hypothetical protein